MRRTRGKTVKPTARQMQVYELLRRWIVPNYAPVTVREIQAELGLASPNGAREILLELERKKLIRREPGKTGIRVLKRPEE